MQSLIQKWGNSLALRIPKPFAREIGLDRGMPVDVSLEDGRLIISPVTEPPIALGWLLERVTEDNIHREVDTGASTGREEW